MSLCEWGLKRHNDYQDMQKHTIHLSLPRLLFSDIVCSDDVSLREKKDIKNLKKDVCIQALAKTVAAAGGLWSSPPLSL